MKKYIPLLIVLGLTFDSNAAPTSMALQSSATVNPAPSGVPAESGVPSENGVSTESGIPAENGVPSESGIPAEQFLHYAKPKELFLHSSVALVLDEKDDVILYGRKIDEKRPIASLTKLMTAMVILDANLSLDEKIKINRADRDRLRGSKSRLSYGTTLSRYDALSIALAASENRAAHALARTYPGGKKAFVNAMNAKAKALGMSKTYFKGPTGLNSKNTSTARDLVKMVNAAKGYELIHAMTTQGKGEVTDLRSGWEIEFLNTNRLVRKDNWNIGLSKTGYIADAGNCLVMQAEISDRPVIIVLLNSWGKLSKYGDSNRIKQWLIKTESKAKNALAPIPLQENVASNLNRTTHAQIALE